MKNEAAGSLKKAAGAPFGAAGAPLGAAGAVLEAGGAEPRRAWAPSLTTEYGPMRQGD